MEKTRPRRARPSYAGYFRANISDKESITSDNDVQSEIVDGSSSSNIEDVEDAEEALVLLDDDGDLQVSNPVASGAPGPVAGNGGQSRTRNSKRRHSRQNKSFVHDTQGLQTVPQPQRLGQSARNIKPKEHRYRPDSIWSSKSDTLRLSRRPQPFNPPFLVPTASTSDPRIAYRVKKSWMYSVGPGPCWELIEDRGFFKEEYIGTMAGTGRITRPLVYSETSHLLGYCKELLLGQSSRYNVESQPVSCFVGPYGAQDLKEIDQFSSVPTGGSLSVMFNSGGRITAVDWCPTTISASLGGRQYLAVSSTNNAFLGVGTRSHSPAMIQLWSINPARSDEALEVQCEVIMCIDEGAVLQLKWCPLPSHSEGERKLGLLAAITTDGAAHIYVAPMLGDGPLGSHHMRRVHCRPLLTMAFDETTCQALDWANSEVIAIGCSNGFVGVFRVKDAILGIGNAPLTHYFPVHQTSVQSIAWVRAPPGISDGTYDLVGDPTVICTTGSEGSVRVTDIRDCMSRMLFRNREVPHASAFAAFCGSLVATDVDFSVKLFQLQPTALGMGHSVADVGGTALALSVSDIHPYVAIGCADGSCITTNLLRGTRREGVVPFLNHKVFQLDYSPRDGHYRMLDRFLPVENGANEAMVYKESVTRNANNDKVVANTEDRFKQGCLEASGLWHPNVAVTAVAWNSGCGLGCAPFLVSGTASGLVRVDYLEGMWAKGTVPYGSIECIRGEDGQVEEEGGIEADSE
ncbi:hypothetical protein FRC14_000856 [Serendipita sp. 396]|nr:hypothetical protein FRC14_000856 [Serendipita sp. 396]